MGVHDWKFSSVSRVLKIGELYVALLPLKHLRNLAAHVKTLECDMSFTFILILLAMSQCEDALLNIKLRIIRLASKIGRASRKQAILSTSAATYCVLSSCAYKF